MYQTDVLTISGSIAGSPIRILIFSRTLLSGERSGSPLLMSNPHPAIHCVQGRTARRRPMPISPKLASGVTIQFRMLGRCLLYLERSALKIV